MEWRLIGLALAVCLNTKFGFASFSFSVSTARPHLEESKNIPIPRPEFDALLGRSEKLLNVHDDQYDNSIRNHIVKSALKAEFGEDRVKSLPLAVQRNKQNSEFVTWSGTDTVLGTFSKHVELRPETRVTRLVLSAVGNKIEGVLCRDLKTKKDFLIKAKVRILLCY